MVVFRQFYLVAASKADRGFTSKTVSLRWGLAIAYIHDLVNYMLISSWQLAEHIWILLIICLFLLCNRLHLSGWILVKLIR